MPSEDDWRHAWPPREQVDRRAKLREDRLWLREHLIPWVGRRLRGTSSGDAVDPKRPRLEPFHGLEP